MNETEWAELVAQVEEHGSSRIHFYFDVGDEFQEMFFNDVFYDTHDDPGQIKIVLVQ